MDLYWIRLPVVIGVLTPSVWVVGDASLALTLAMILARAAAGASNGVFHEIAAGAGNDGRAEAFARRAMRRVDPRLRDANGIGDARLLVWVPV